MYIYIYIVTYIYIYIYIVTVQARLREVPGLRGGARGAKREGAPSYKYIYIYI